MHIAFVSSPLAPENDQQFDSFDFFAILLGGIVRHAQEFNHRVTVFVPQKSNATGSNQEAILRGSVLAEPVRFDAVVIAPFSTNAVEKVIKEYFASVTANGACRAKQQESKILRRIAFVDKKIDLQDVKVPEGILIHNVVCDNLTGGKSAAEVLHRNFVDRKNRKLTTAREQRFMVLRGLEGSEDRFEGFRKRMAELVYQPGLQIEQPRSDYLNFTRAGARKWMRDELAGLESGNRNSFGKLDPAVSWGIFACNDEMALGIRAVISNRYHELRQTLAAATTMSADKVKYHGNFTTDYQLLIFLQEIRIVGFDGIAPARDLINPGDNPMRPDPWLIGTIDARIERQSAATIQWIHQHQQSAVTGGPGPGLQIVDIASVTAAGGAIT